MSDDEKGKPFAVVEHYSGSDQAYQKVAVWNVGQIWELSHGRLDNIKLASSNYSKTRFKFSVAGKVLFRDIELVEALTVTFPDNELPFGEEVILECKSSDGTAIAVDAIIAGTEYKGG